MISPRNTMNLCTAMVLALISTTSSPTGATGNDTKGEISQILPANVVPAVVIQQRPEHVVSGYDGGHHYEQQPNEQIRDGSKPLVQLMDVSMLSNSNNDADLYIGVSKPEPRNEIEDPVQQPQSQSTGQQDPAIIDHRPPAQQQQQQQPYLTNLDSQQPSASSSDSAQQPTTTTQMPPSTTPSAATSAPIITYNVTPQITATSAPTSQSQTSANQATNSQPQPSPQSQPAPQPQTKQPQHTSSTWYPGQLPLNYQQTSPDASSASASNQVMSSVQHPNSINAIITSDNQARSMQSNGIPQQQQQMQTAPSQQLVTVNGQPMLLVNPNHVHTGGRRISISGWLKNISSILTNIFNRREHGPAINAHSQVAAGPLSHWMLGSGLNSHSWLSGAQQMVQQPYMMLASNRHQHQSLNYAQQQAPQQQLPADLQASASSNSFATITSPQATYQPAAQMMQLSQVPAPASVVRQASPIPLQQSQPIHTSLLSQPAPVTSMTLQSNQPPGTRPASVVASSTSPVVQQNSPQSIVRSNRSPSNSGLPLAHYSRYSANMD